MISLALFAISIHQDTATFQFHPKVGESYRYEMSMEDASGAPLLSKEGKFYSIFKVAELKEGKYKVIQTTEALFPGQKADSRLQGTYRIDSSMNTEVIPNDGEKKTLAGVEVFATTVNGCFGLLFPPDSMKVGQKWKAPLDIVPVAKDNMKGLVPNGTYDGTCNRSFTLDALDAKKGIIKSQIDCAVDISGTENGVKRQARIEQIFAQTTQIDLATGMPIKLDRKFSLTLTSGTQRKEMNMIIHLNRVP